MSAPLFSNRHFRTLPIWPGMLVALLLAGFCGTEAWSQGVCNPPCDDGNACTNDVCDLDLLQCSHTPVNCADTNPCTVDSCDPALGCRHAPGPDGVACDDHLASTCNDHCQAGTCVGGLSCDDGNICTVDVCDQTLCLHSPVPDGQACDDHLPQTCFDHCQAGTCVSDNLCNCPTNCDDGNPCTDDRCDLQGNCTNTPRNCYDTNPCTYDYCDLLTGQCVHDWLALERLGCSSGGCTVGGECLGGQCFGGQPRNCDDNDPCTSDSCNPGTGCLHVPFLKDSDADAHVDAACGGSDCNDQDPGAWHAVSEVVNLQAANPSPTSITWDSQAVATGPGITYEVASGLIPTPGAGYLSPACLAAGAIASYDDGRPAPPLNQLYWYLVRARNSCGTGDYGHASDGVPRSIAACP